MPVSSTYARTSWVTSGYVYDEFSGRSRWSMRSNPQGGLVWVPTMLWMPSRWTKSTVESAANRLARASLIVAENPRNALVYVCLTVAPYLPASELARLLTLAPSDLSTTT
jgi:hypothetical protein